MWTLTTELTCRVLALLLPGALAVEVMATRMVEDSVSGTIR
jgi:hypothetical protein